LSEETQCYSFGLTMAGNGNKWYVKNTSDGKQIWVQVRDREIRNGGIYNTPKIYNERSGLSRN